MKQKKRYRRLLSLLLTFVLLFSVMPNTFAAVDVNGKKHVRTEKRYEQEKKQSDKTPKTAEDHHHDETCYCPGGEYICGLEEKEEHVHTEACYAPASEIELASDSEAQEKELICGLEETEGHTHTEDCVCPGGELICGREGTADNSVSTYALKWDGGEILNAQDLLNACTYADDGATLTLGANITYDQSTLGSIVISKKLTLDCNGYKISVDDALFEITAEGDLTIVKANLESTKDDIIDEIKGSLTIESTAGDGIVSDDNFISDNYGKVYIKDGKFTLGYSLVYENYENAEVIIDTAEVDAEDYLVGYLEDSSCSLYIKDGYFVAGYYIVSGTNGNIVIENGTFQSAEDCFDSIYSGVVTIKDGHFTAGNVKNKYACFDIYVDSDEELSATLNIEDGTFNSTDNTIYADGKPEINISGGTFISETNTVYADGDTVINLSGGEFTNTTGSPAFLLKNSSVVNIVEGYHTDPDEWEEADHVKVIPDIITVTFHAEDTVYKELTGKLDEIDFPEPPTHSEGYKFCYWELADGTVVNDLSDLKKSSDLYAVFSDRTYTVTFNDKGVLSTETVTAGTPLGQVPGLDRREAGDSFICWKLGTEPVDETQESPVTSDLTLTAVYQGMVMNYQELTEALNNKEEEIVLGADIFVENTVEVNYPCTIMSYGKFGLIRPDDFLGTLLSVQQGEDNDGTDGDTEDAKVVLTLKNILVDGRNIEAESSAIDLDEGTKLCAENVTIQNNKNNGTTEDYRSIDGGGIRIYAAGLRLVDSEIRNCSASNGQGGAIYASTGRVDSSDEDFIIKNSTIANNTAGSGVGAIYVTYYNNVTIADSLIDANRVYGDNSNVAGLYINRCGDLDVKTEEEALQSDKWVIIENTTISNNKGASFAGGMDVYGSLVKLCGTTKICGNEASRSGGGVYSSECGLLFLYDDTTICHNKAEKGGGIYQNELRVFMHDTSSVCYNEAVDYGGGVYVGYELFKMYDSASIHDNKAGTDGGGIYCRDDSYLFAGMIYDNTAGDEGDDIYNSASEYYERNSLKYLFTTQPERVYGSGDSTKLGTVLAQLIVGYDKLPTELDGITIPFRGWFEDDYDSFYSNMDNSRLITNTINVEDKISADPLLYGYKAIWYGLLLAYDANYEGTTDHQYDSNGYLPGTDADVSDNMFNRAGYKFIGWNTAADGSGTAYEAGDRILMDKSQVLYAQWEKLPDLGNLMISKTLSGNAVDSNKEFHFVATMSDATLNGTYGEMEFVNGVAEITLKGGEKKTATGLPAGITYETAEKEANQDGYTTTSVGESGTILKDETVTAAFVNAKSNDPEPPTPPTPPTPPEPSDETGRLIVSKTVAGDAGNTTKDFTFQVIVNDSQLNGQYGDLEFANGTAVFTLKHNESKMAQGLPAGLTYEVSEFEANQNGYVTTSTGEFGVIEKDSTATAAFTNTKNGGHHNDGGNSGDDSDNEYGNLKVSKTVTGSAGDKEKAFTFTVTVGMSLTGTYGDMTFDHGTAVFTLKHGESRKASDIPAGIRYTVTESDNDGYTVTSTGAEGKITDGKTAIAAFTNHRDAGTNRTDGSDSSNSGGDGGQNCTETVTPSETGGSSEQTKENQEKTDQVPKTGDMTNTVYWMLLLGVSLSGIVILVLLKRRREQE